MLAAAALLRQNNDFFVESRSAPAFLSAIFLETGFFFAIALYGDWKPLPGRNDLAMRATIGS